MDQTRTNTWRQKFKTWHESHAKGKGWLCAGKNPIVWVLAFYIIKGTAVTLAAVAAVLFAF